MDPNTVSHGVRDNEAAELLCAGGLLAGTLALMTAFAAPDEGGLLADSSRRTLAARKIVSNLFFLQQHPALGEPMRRVMANVRMRWLPLMQADASAPAAARSDALAANTRWH
jgi:hypothetical protein